MIRLVEHQPAWELHAFLRFNDIPYVSEYSPSPVALGRTLPALADCCKVYSGEQIYECNVIKGTKKVFSPTEIELDELVASSIQCGLVRILDNLLLRRGEHISTEREHGLIGALFACTTELAEAITLTSREDHFPDESENALLARLDATYKVLSYSLGFNHDGSSICNHWLAHSKPSVKVARHGKADALLFGHLARAMGHPMVFPILNQYENIRDYFRGVARRYFGPLAHHDVPAVWQLSLDTLMRNAFVSAESFNEVKEVLSHGQDVLLDVDRDEAHAMLQELAFRHVHDQPVIMVSTEELLGSVPQGLQGRIAAGVLLGAVTYSFLGYFYYTLSRK